jgi:hypothetical protein
VPKGPSADAYDKPVSDASTTDCDAVLNTNGRANIVTDSDANAGGSARLLATGPERVV